jgi:hypothetical protein
MTTDTAATDMSEAPPLLRPGADYIALLLIADTLGLLDDDDDGR